MLNAKNQVFLSLDTACGAGSVAVFVRGSCVAFKVDAGAGVQARELIPMVEATLAEAKLEYADVDSILSTVGPGSFTGLRIALSAARALGLALSKPVIGISTLAAAAAAHNLPHTVVLNAGKGEVFAQAFNEGLEPVFEVSLQPLQPIPTLPNAQLAGLALLKNPALGCAPEPLYIRPPDAKLPTPKAI